MDSHSRSASPREPMRPQHRPPSPPSSPGAFDNRAYQHDDADPNHNDSFTSNGPQQNGHSKEPNGDTKLPEAVNLELINLTPKNGTKKKDVEVDMNTSNPYDEYFVPVNEHRKFMRGEKLYVTADKRGEKGGCKRPLCWTLLVLVVAAIVAIIVLAATGILFSSSPTTLEQYNTSISSARALGGIGGHDHHDHDHDDHDHDHAHHDHPTTDPVQIQHGPDTQNDGPVQSIGSDESDLTLYVPRTVEGEVTIDNEEFTSALEDQESAEYREFVATFSDGLKHALFDRNTLENGDNDVIVEVVQLRKGSVIVTYRIHWKPKPNAEPTADILSPQSLKTKLDKYLANNNRMINVYHVAEENMSTKHVLDICQIDNNHCEHGCEFDETNLEFTCTCRHGQILDMINPKKCMSILENAYPLEPKEKTTQKEVKVLETDTNPSTRIPVPEEEKPITESVHVNNNENVFDWKETHHALPETTTESDTDINLSHIFGHGNLDDTTEVPVPEPNSESTSPKATAEPKAEPSPTLEPKPEPEPTAEPKPEPEPTTEPKPEPEPAAAEPKPEPEPKPELETAAAEPKPEPAAAEPKPEPEPAAAEPKPEPAAAEPKPEPEPAAEPKPEPEPAAEPKSMTDTTSEPKPEPTAEPITEPQPASEPAAPNEPAAELTAGPAAQPSPESEPKPEPEPSSEHTSLEHDTVSLEVIRIPSQTTESVPLPTFEPKPEPEPTSEPQTEPKPTSETRLSVETTTKTKFSVEVHQTIDQESKPTTSDSLEQVTEPVLIERQTEHHTERGGNSEEQTTLMIHEGNYDSNSADEMESTTIRVSISEPHIINEPSYEPKPEIISILSEKKENDSKFVSESNSEPTTEQSGWLQDNLDSYMKKPIQFQNNYNTNINEDHNDSEQRSFKTIDIFSDDTTTTKTEDQNISADIISREDKSAVTDTSKKDNDEVTTLANQAADNSDHDIETISHLDTIAKELGDQKTVVADISKEDNSTGSKANAREKNHNEESLVTTIMHEGRSLDSNEDTAITTAPESAKEHSISEQLPSTSEVEKKLMEALEKRKETISETTTEKNTVDESMDITFDTINMLYNRSSKSIENRNFSKPEVTERNDIETTTVSDWLFEPVTEIKFEEAMNKMEKHETTEPSITKIDEIINDGVTKDDFEPDYLNNMSSNNNKMGEHEQDEPMFGMSPDYDSEDPRVKRVNEENVGSSNAAMTTASSKVTEKQNITESTSASIPIETTTVIEYIYKTAENVANVTVSPVPQNNNEVVILTTTSSTEKSEPAPVWEDSEADRDLTVKELEKPVHTMEKTTTASVIPIDDILINTTPSTITTSTMATPTTLSSASEAAPAPTTISNIQEIPRSENGTESQTQVNNLNVTIYEISSHNGNNSFAVTNQHSGELDDHETEMNPFLPEAENNKSLVKKLQEGHDIEPTTFNETQNEHADEHSKNTSETTTHVINNDDLTILAKANENKVTTEGYTTFNELMKLDSQENRTEEDQVILKTVSKTVSKNNEDVKTEQRETKPISSFLLDTDDLDNDKEHTTEHKTTIAENNLENGAITPSSSSPVDLNDESDYLSVVPIEDERLEEKEALKKDYGSELNDISDSPKKSDRRTLDETKFDSVNDNEA